MTQEHAPHTAAVRTAQEVDRDVVLDVLFRAQYAALLRLGMVLIGSREEAERLSRTRSCPCIGTGRGCGRPGRRVLTCARPS